MTPTLVALVKWLQRAWLSALADSGNEDAAFFSFGRWEASHTVWDDGEAGAFVEQAYEALCADVDALQRLRRCEALERLLTLPAPDVGSATWLQVDRQRASRIPPRSGGEKRCARLGMRRPFAEQDFFAAEFSPDLVRVPPVGGSRVPCFLRGPTRRCFLVVHLFSGHSRRHDFHWRLHRLADGGPSMWQCCH